jgi:hypothetical protein
MILEEIENIEPVEKWDNIDILDELNELEQEESIEIKVKKPRSEKQINAFKEVQAIRDKNRKERAEEREKQKDLIKKEIETKVLKKAISIKKKQIKQELLLDEISDDDEPIEIIKKKIVKKQTRVAVAEKPKMKFTFV